MGSATDVVEISSDDEDFGVDKLVDDDYDWISEFLEDKELEGLDDILVVDELSAPASTQKTASATRDDSDDECMVLDEDPDKPVAVANGKSGGGDGSDDLLIVGEKGQLACRDYPHPRHLCARFPFSSTPHENHCEMCHCYVCDSPAPCIYWSSGVPLAGHCHSTDKQGNWKTLRAAFKQRNKAAPQPQKPPDTTQSMIPPLQNAISARRRHPGSLPSPSSRPSTLRPCSLTRVATRTPISQRQHSHPIIITCHGQSIGERQTKKRGAGALGAQIMQPHPKFRRVGTTGNSLHNMNQWQDIISHHSRLYRGTTQRSQCPPATLVEENMKKWQEILDGVAADLGVSESGNGSSTEFQSVSSQPIAWDQFLSQTNVSQNTDIYAHPDPQVANLDSLDFDDSWLNNSTTGQIIAEDNRIEHSQPVTEQSSNPSVSGEIHWESFLASSAGQKPVLGAKSESGLLELDPAGVLDFDNTLSSTTQV